MKIYTIIAIYNGMRRNWIQKCFDSLLASSVKTEIIAIDNGSTDGSIEFIQENYPQVDFIIANENLGFAKANNLGIKKAYDNGADYVFLLNQDAWIEKDTIAKLLCTFEKETDAGIVSPIHLNGAGVDLDIGFANYISKENTPRLISDLFFNRLQENYETHFVNAAAWLISRECIKKVGGFDTSVFYHYGEDDNYCHRTKYHAYKIYINTTTTIWHDREKRKGSWTVEHESRKKMVSFCARFANILTPCETIEHEFFLLIKGKRRSLLKTLLKLNLKEALEIKKEMQNKKSFFKTIKISREKNKKGNLVWL